MGCGLIHMPVNQAGEITDSDAYLCIVCLFNRSYCSSYYLHIWQCVTDLIKPAACRF